MCLEINLATVPLFGMAALGIVASLFLLIYWDGYWKTYARTFFKVTALGALVSIAQMWMMSVHTGVQARLVYSIALPLVFLGQLAIIEAFMVCFHISKPPWFSNIWWGGALFFCASVALHTHIYPILHRVPSGYFFASPPSAIGFSVLKITVFGSTFVGLLYTVLLGLRMRSARQRWPYAIAVCFYALCMVNDGVILQHYRTLYPTAWVSEVILYGMLWNEVRWHMKDVYRRLNHDALTGAFSRSFGEFYLAELLHTREVGLLYADIDHFKEINDTYGHHVGDQALKLLVHLLRPVVQSPNALIRLGGDEFLLVFPDAAPGDEERLRTAIQAALDDHLLLHDEQGMRIANLSISLGWAHATKGASWARVLHQADLSMYKHKEARRRP
ncbi:GGDEF domain-containing protein [Alicyclobacillus suci]|uniref:GGDEF domain-containing protein n=1 Tax=Alicyclobacillus suci TaxID=2816080 RepID=UPI0011BF7265|nr:GGDEF domain-containing protein [Alicyclobacillus suci]